MTRRRWSKALQEALACLIGAGSGALIGGWLHSPLLAFVGVILGAASGSQASKLWAAPGSGALRGGRRWVG